MNQITVIDWNINRIMDVVHDLRAQGLVQGQDFDFAYYPGEVTTDEFHIATQRRTVFTFYTESMATWFAIKYI